MEIRDMEEKDIGRLIEMEKECFSDPWTEKLFLYELNDNKLSRYVVGIVDGEIVAYGGIWFIFDTGHITNIAVAKAHRNKGYGGQILQGIIDMCKELKFTTVMLEVRESNESAKHLYDKYGFVAFDVRKGYYTNNKEDAIVMAKAI